MSSRLGGHADLERFLSLPEPSQETQDAPAARKSSGASCDLQDVCTLHDSAEMGEEARAVASRILAACPA
jgi:hypothetical protein